MSSTKCNTLSSGKCNRLSSAKCNTLSSDPCSRGRVSTLPGWYALHARDLPWRHTTDPYRIWISEIMLQQTQVATVLPRFSAWLDAFPDIVSLAAADSDAVLKAWEGLGYYRRARFIHAAAKLIVERHAGIFPRDFEAILALPGIGRSTAGAISSFCFGTCTPVLDGNVKRVLKRWHAAPDAVDKVLWELAQSAIEIAGAPDAWNQAMMELGATLCIPTRPRCAQCPVSGHCACAFQVKPARKRKAKVAVQNVHWQVHLYRHAEKGIWLTQRPDSGIWAGLWTPPISELAQAPGIAPSYIHLLTHRRIHLYAEESKSDPAGHGQWVADPALLALPTGIHRLLARYGEKP